MNLVLGLLPSLLFGTMALMIGAWPSSPRRQNSSLLMGAGLLSLGAVPLVEGRWSLTALAMGTLSGLMWSGGQVAVLRGIKAWGVSRTIPVTTALQLVINAAVGVLLLGEWRAPGAMALGVVALVLIMAGAAACSWQERRTAGPTPAQRREGLAATAASAVLYGLYPGMLRLSQVSGADAVGPMGLGLLLGAVACAVLLPRTETLVGARSPQAAVAGMVWAVGNALLLRSTTTLGVATGFTLSQLGFVVATLGGMLLLGETRSPKETVVAVTGVLVAVAGVVLMGLASGR